MKTERLGACLLSCAIAVALSGCDRGDPSHSSQSAAEQSATVRAEELQAREQQLAQREAEIQAKEAEQEQARQAEIEAQQREAEKAAAAREAAAKQAAARKAAQTQAASAQAASAPPVVAPSAPVKTAPVPVAVEVPSGTQLLVALAADLSTKTAKVGESFEARLVSDLTSSDRVVAPAGARVKGTITEVMSGSSAIGAVPMLGLRFDQLELADGSHVAIRGELQQQGQSEKGRDTAKIVGGAAAGAVIGHQIKHGTKGQVIGGILGGAAGAVVAKNTGTEVQLPAGSQLSIVLAEGFVVGSR